MLSAEDFMEIFQAPEFIKPFIQHFVTEQEMELIVRMKNRSLAEDEIVSLMKDTVTDVNELLEHAYRREVLNKEVKDGIIYYTISNFYARLDNHSKWGNYYVLPRNIRKKLDKWCFEEYLKRHNHFQEVIVSDPDYDNCHNDWILLLSEVEEMIDAARALRVVPVTARCCDNCDRPREVCLYFDDHITDRTGGRTLTKEEAKELVRMADKKGLMHTGGPYNWKVKGLSVVCNCCIDCCYPFRAAQKFGTKGKWPKSRYIAKYDAEKCRLCGLCTKRCPFGAFCFGDTEVEKDGKLKKNVMFDPELCWGCGLCANSCPAGAIVMDKI